ncbi:MAG: hypothetical protein KBT12_01830 [Bacteroidales bacterium]|nr:hypothetical protein [Candidatus Physcousia equi]
MKRTLLASAALALTLAACQGKKTSNDETQADTTQVADQSAPQLPEVDITPIHAALPCSKTELDKAWQEAALQCGMDDWTFSPEAYLLIDVDGDAHPELFVQGGGLYAAYLVDEGELQLLCTAIGEYAAIAVAPYTIAQITESGFEAGWGVFTYYHIEHSSLQHYLEHSIACDPDAAPDATEPKITYMLGGEGFAEQLQEISEDYAAHYLPQHEPVRIAQFREDWMSIGD